MYWAAQDPKLSQGAQICKNIRIWIRRLEMSLKVVGHPVRNVAEHLGGMPENTNVYRHWSVCRSYWLSVADVIVYLLIDLCCQVHIVNKIYKIYKYYKYI